MLEKNNTDKLEFSVHLNYHFKVREKIKTMFRLIKNVGVYHQINFTKVVINQCNPESRRKVNNVNNEKTETTKLYVV